MNGKRKVVVVWALIAIILGLAGGWALYSRNASGKCYETVGGGCLPRGKCAAPNDAIVDCEKLRQNPTKTDWLGNE